MSLINSVEYFYNSLPYSLSVINIQICSQNESCPSTINIFGLRRSFYTLPSMFQTIITTTINGDTISSLTISTSQFNPLKISQNLSLLVSQPTTNLYSSYLFNFTIDKLPFDSGLTVTLSPMH